MLIHKTKPSTFKGLKPVTPAVGNSGRVCSSLPQMVISQQVHLGVCGVFGEPPASARGTSSASWGNEGWGSGERLGREARRASEADVFWGVLHPSPFRPPSGSWGPAAGFLTSQAKMPRTWTLTSLGPKPRAHWRQLRPCPSHVATGPWFLFCAAIQQMMLCLMLLGAPHPAPPGYRPHLAPWGQQASSLSHQ